MDPENKENIPKRKGHPKSRNGCRTCKIRKVKCDETKPTCNRCHKEGHSCDGYPTPPPRKNASKRHAPPSTMTALLKWEPSPQPFTYQPTTALFENQAEHSYYRLFCDRVANSSSFDPSLWDSLVLQACERDVSIRLAVIALGALKLTSETTSQLDFQEAKAHHYSALQHYNRAIRSMRKTAMSGKQDVNITLIACILICCFEQGQGHYLSSLTQITIGLDLIEGYMARSATAKVQLPAIEDKLFYAFERLDVQSVCFIDPHSWKRHKVLQKLVPNDIDIDTMPSQFLNLSEAKNYYSIISRRLMELVSEGQPGEEHKQEISQYLSKLHFWHEAFLPLFNTARSHKSHSNYLLATLLELNHVLINLTTSLDRTSSLQHAKSAMPAMRELVSLIEDMLLHPSMSYNTGAFTLEIQVTAPLNFVAWVCPERSLRRKAISLMIDHPRKEALWDSRVVGRIAECVMEQEEMNMDGELGEFSPDDGKCVGTDIFDFDLVRRRTRMRCLLPKKMEDGARRFEWIPKEGAVVTW